MKKNVKVCDKCLTEISMPTDIYKCPCGGILRHQCEKSGCNLPATKSVYAMGYIAIVCQDHYNQASQADKDDAINFRYSE